MVAAVVCAVCTASTARGAEFALDSDVSACPHAASEKPATKARATPKARPALRCMVYLVLLG